MLRTNVFSFARFFEKQLGNIIRRYSSDIKKERERHIGFDYYPRYPGEELPKVDPPKIFMVQLIKTVRGKPWWDRKRLMQIGLNARICHRGIVLMKNNPENCGLLWKVKHLVRITPVTFPNGEPTVEDIGATHLDTQGRMHVSEKYRADEAAFKACCDFWRDEKTLRHSTKKADSHFKWNVGFDLD